MAVIILQHVSASSPHTVHLKLLHKVVICQLYLNKAGGENPSGQERAFSQWEQWGSSNGRKKWVASGMNGLTGAKLRRVMWTWQEETPETRPALFMGSSGGASAETEATWGGHRVALEAVTQDPWYGCLWEHVGSLEPGWRQEDHVRQDASEAYI